MNCESVTHVGAVYNTGIDLDMVAATDGTQSNIGIDINVSGADYNTGLYIVTADTHIKLAAGADPVTDYATFSVADTGDLTIATEGDGTTDSDIILDPDGDLLLQPATHTCSELPIGFTQDEPTFDATDTIVLFSTKGNKAKVTLTDNCADIHFKFPKVSGNFICVLLQDGTGGRTLTSWKTQDSEGNAGAGNGGRVLWAGGSTPLNTETANKADIASFYWDADNEIAYGTYSYNF
jgi:hypothetical protein